MDRTTLAYILSDFYNKEMLEDNYQFCPLAVYRAPYKDETLEETIAYLETLPDEESPEVFGLHENARLSHERTETYDLLNRILNLQPKAIE